MEVLVSRIYIFTLSTWFSISLFIDIFVVPTVFRTVSNIQESSDIGIKVFSIFNSIEFILAILLLVLGVWYRNYMQWGKNVKGVIIFLWILLFVLSASYKFHITPMISSLTLEMRDNGLGSVAAATVANAHNFYHDLYVKLDYSKIFVLLFLLLFTLKRLKFEKDDC